MPCPKALHGTILTLEAWHGLASSSAFFSGFHFKVSTLLVYSVHGVRSVFPPEPASPNIPTFDTPHDCGRSTDFMPNHRRRRDQLEMAIFPALPKMARVFFSGFFFWSNQSSTFVSAHYLLILRSCLLSVHTSHFRAGAFFLSILFQTGYHDPDKITLSQ